MRHRTVKATAIALALTCSGAALSAASVSASTSLASSTVVQEPSPIVQSAAQIEATPAASAIEFSVSLQPRDPAGAVSLAQAVSEPSSPSYGQYLTPGEWEARFSPTESSVGAVSAWLRSQGITVDAVTPDRMTIHASAPAATVEQAFGTTLGEFSEQGHLVRLAKEALKVPSSLAGLISGISGVGQSLARRTSLTGGEGPRAAGKPAKSEPIPPPPGFRSAPPCSSYYGQKHDTTDPPYGDGFPYPLPYAVCGYKPAQLQGAYGLAPYITGGDDGKGVKVAIVDAYASPTLFSDAHEYSERNQSGELLESSQFSESISKTFTELELCEAPEWSVEQTLDVESVHTTAPGAHILYVGAKSCLNEDLDAAVQKVVDGHLAQIITDSWTGDEGELLEEEGSRKAFDNVLLMADGTGVGVQFSAGDEGDEFTVVGMDVANYPASSPYVTAVGGTSLQIGKGDERIGEFGWSTGKSVLCTSLLEADEYPGCKTARLETWLPPAPGFFDYGGGGGTTYDYPEPSYQEAVVPAALAERNSALTGERNRVVPDISMDADPSTGILVGETQEFPNGVYYDEYRLGGTSLASPLFAGVMADADQAAGKALGFVNPLLYKLDSLPATAERAFYDVVPGGKQAMARVDYLNSVNAKEGLLTSVRVIEYEGRQEYCDGAASCEQQKNILSTGPGFDSMTGIGTPASGLVSELANP
ncbi:MAG TPA: S53 family peptidase [Solirubrobacteraceae bacterium]|nr:S53 family peptidase [Solirubrobacteraceae bacterium]